MDTTRDMSSLFDPLGRATVHVFGGLRVWRGSHEVQAVPPRQRLILAELICAAGSVVSVAELIDALWEEDPPASAINQVHRIVGQLRRMLEPGLSPHAVGSLVLASGAGYRIATNLIRCDLYELRALVRQAALALNDGDPSAAGECYAAALDLSQGALFGGLQATMAARPEFVAVEQERVATAAAAADLAIVHGCSVQTLSAITTIAASVPLDEALHARLIALLAAAGRRGEALAAFDVMRRRLADELGVDPGRELSRVYRDLLALDDQVPDPDTSAASPRMPAQLPRALPGFVERSDVKALLRGDLASPGETVVITAFGGMGGIGKTALAVQWAHQVINDFPDGQLYLNMRGFCPGGHAVDPGDAVNGFLEALGQSVADLEGMTVEARAARYRSLMAGRKMIVVLDNVRDSDQVRPLLPGSPQCLVLVTSRNRLTSLVAREGARFVPLGRLTPSEARELLMNRLGEPRVLAEAAAVDQIITGCAGLPLALTIVAARIATTPELPMAELVSQLFGSGTGLDELSTGENRDDVRTVFSWSYEALSVDGARLFRLLGGHPGPDFSLTSVASMLGVSTTRARRTTGELTAANMLTGSSMDRYVMHDLLRVYASELLDAGGGRRDAEHRIIEHYALATRAAYQAYGRPPIAELHTVNADLVAEKVQSIRDAVAWYVRERSSLEAVVNLAIKHGLVRSAVLLVLDRRPMNQTVDAQSDSLPQCLRVQEAADRPQPGQVVEPALLGELHRDIAHRFVVENASGSEASAQKHYERALSLFTSVDDLSGQSNVYRSRCVDASLRGDEDAGLGFAREALRLARLANRPDLVALNLLGLCGSLSELERHAEAIDVALEALDAANDLGLDYVKPNLGLTLALGRLMLGEPAEALSIAGWALNLTADADDVSLEVALLAVAAQAAADAGERDSAVRYVERFHRMISGDGAAAVAARGMPAATLQRFRVMVEQASRTVDDREPTSMMPPTALSTADTGLPSRGPEEYRVSRLAGPDAGQGQRSSGFRSHRPAR